MAQVLIRNLDEETVLALKARAAARGHSLELELRMLLKAAAQPTRREVRERAAELRAMQKRPVSTDLEATVREDRKR